ncbi:nickel-responsive transcriptional regulator NikR [Sneathiella limimaris]|uniref:nickel-responsive transcriptional regulator NikR n=1 Tax=Sneathiella limimaris TaxID=1964213 RepID=UPI00146B4D5B|nr:nickel-responsive transcriptional regulator NikR [Sneathiella limimaris]
MERVTITVEDELLAEFDAYLERNGYANRSEGIRDAVRHMLSHEQETIGADQNCIGCISYTVKYSEKSGPSKPSDRIRFSPDLIVSTLQMPIDSHSYVEATLLRGAGDVVHKRGHEIMSMSGTSYGRMNIIPVK